MVFCVIVLLLDKVSNSMPILEFVPLAVIVLLKIEFHDDVDE